MEEVDARAAERPGPPEPEAPSSLEIERKYLVVETPDLAEPSLAAAERWHIEQIFLTPVGGWGRRIRQVTLADGDQVHYFTRKRRISSLVRDEDERTISREEYERLRQEASPDHLPLYKTRLIFSDQGHKWELDLFDRYPTLFLLEVELASEDEDATPPGFLGPTREVTYEEGYTSRALAQRTPPAALRPYERR